MTSPEIVRPTTEEERSDLKAATRDSLRRVRANKFALVTRVKAPALSDYGSISSGDFMPVDILADLQMEFPSGVASPLLETLAAICGFKLIPIDDNDGTGIEVDDITRLMKEGGEAKAAALKAVGATCINTVREAKKETSEARDEYTTALRKLRNQERRLMGAA